MSDSTTIVSLQAENIKRLRAVSITPDGSMVIIGGRNAQGKSSLLDSIAFALGGKAGVPEAVLRDGARRGKVTCDLGDLTVTRTFTPGGGGQLTVTNADGKKMTSPQAILDALTGSLTFDPLAWFKMDERKQLETLRELVGLDLSELDRKREAAYAKRTEVNRDGKERAAQLEGMTRYPDAPAEEVSIAALVEEQEKGQKIQQEVADKWVRVANAEKALAHWQEQRVDAEKALAQATEHVVRDTKLLADATKEAKRVGANVLDMDAIKAKLQGAEEQNQQVRSNVEYAGKAAKLQALRAESQRLSDELRGIDDQKADKLAAAEFPVEGLSLSETGVLFQGRPFNVASSAEQLRVSVAMGFAMSPRLRVLLIRDGSLLDQDGLKLIAEMAEEAKAQVWIERVGDGDECAVVIEDGMVRGQPE